MTTRLSATAVVFAGALLLGTSAVQGQGIVVPGVGPINRSMGGAAAAAPLDAAGAIHWNPATLSGLPSSEVIVGLELLLLSSHVEFAGASTRSDAGVSALPTFAVAWQSDESAWTFGLGLFTIGGFGTNYPVDPLNPILAGGPIYSRLQVLQLVPAAALQVTDHLSVGFAPTLSMADAALDLPPPGLDLTHGTLRWGGGFQAGMYYVTDSCWQFGLSYKSPQWFEGFDYNTDAGPVTLELDYPAIYTLGTAYSGFAGLVWALDLRYVDYDNADFLGEAPPGGLGWQSVFSVATGVQYRLTERLSTRLGYVFTENPVPSELSLQNIPAATIYQHIAAVGLTFQMTARTSLSVSYLRAFENSITSPPPLAVTNRVYIDSLVAGLEVKF